jgi:hypothetical protein
MYINLDIEVNYKENIDDNIISNPIYKDNDEKINEEEQEKKDDELINKQKDSDDEYRECILKVFMLDKYDENEIDKKIQYIIYKLKNNKRYTRELKNFAITRSNSMLLNDEDIGITLLFSYETFDVFYKYLRAMRDYTDDEWNDKHLDLLNNIRRNVIQ